MRLHRVLLDKLPGRRRIAMFRGVDAYTAAGPASPSISSGHSALAAWPDLAVGACIGSGLRAIHFMAYP